MIKLLLTALILLGTISTAQAACRCICVDGVNRQVCDWQYEEISAGYCPYKMCTNSF